MATCYYPWVTTRSNVSRYDVGDEFPAPHSSLRCHTAEQAADLAKIAAYEKGGSPFVVKLVAATGKHHIGGVYELAGYRAPNKGDEADQAELKKLYDAYNAKYGFAKAVVSLAREQVISDEDQRMIRSALAPKRSAADKEASAAKRKTVAHRLDSLLETHGGSLTAAYNSIKDADGDVNAAVRSKLKRLMKSCPPCAGDTAVERQAALAKPKKEPKAKAAKAAKEPTAKADEASKEPKAKKERKGKAEKGATSQIMEKLLKPGADARSGAAFVGPNPKGKAVKIKIDTSVKVHLSDFEQDWGKMPQYDEQPEKQVPSPSPLACSKWGVDHLCKVIDNADYRSALALLAKIVVDCRGYNNDKGQYLRGAAYEMSGSEYEDAHALFQMANDSSEDDRTIRNTFETALQKHSQVVVLLTTTDEFLRIEEGGQGATIGDLLKSCKRSAGGLLTFTPKAEKPAKAAKAAQAKAEKPAKADKPVKPAKAKRGEVVSQEDDDALAAAEMASMSTAAPSAAPSGASAPNAESVAFAKMIAEQMALAAKNF